LSGGAKNKKLKFNLSHPVGLCRGFTERFNRVYREAILDAYLFTDIREVRALTKEWMEENNQRSPDEAQ
jgi:hypothetical protein